MTEIASHSETRETPAAEAAGITTAGFDTGGLTALIERAVGAALRPLEARASDHLATLTARAEPQPRRPEPKGATFARIVRALAVEKGQRRNAAAFAAETYGARHPATKALAASSGAAGGFLVPDEAAGEVIELLRAATVVRRAGALVVPMAGSLLYPKLTAGASAGYVGENQAIGKSEPGFGQLRLTSRKLAALVPVSNDLLRASSPQADQVVIDDLVAGMAVAEDAAFIRDDGTGNAPKGIRFWLAAGNALSQSGVTPAAVETDLKALLDALEGANVRMLRPAWLMAPRVRNHLRFLREANGNLLFPEVREGQLLGFPLFATTAIPTNLGAGTESEVYLVDMADCLIAEEAGIEISVSDGAAYHDGAEVIAAFSQDQTVIRAVAKHDFALRHDRSAAVLSGVTWGA